MPVCGYLLGYLHMLFNRWVGTYFLKKQCPVQLEQDDVVLAVSFEFDSKAPMEQHYIDQFSQNNEGFR